MKKENTYLRKFARVGRIYPKVIVNAVQDKIQSESKLKSKLSLNNQSNPPLDE